MELKLCKHVINLRNALMLFTSKQSIMQSLRNTSSSSTRRVTRVSCQHISIHYAQIQNKKNKASVYILFLQFNISLLLLVSRNNRCKLIQILLLFLKDDYQPQIYGDKQMTQTKCFIYLFLCYIETDRASSVLHTFMGSEVTAIHNLLQKRAQNFCFRRHKG